MGDEQKNGPIVNPIQDLTLPAYAMVNGIQVQLFRTIDEYALKTIKEQSAPKIVVFTKRNMDNYDTIVYSADEFLKKYSSSAMQEKIGNAIKLSEEIRGSLSTILSIVTPTIGGNLTDNKETLAELFKYNESFKGKFTQYISNIKKQIPQINPKTLKTTSTLINDLVQAKNTIQLMINSAMGKKSTIPNMTVVNKLFRRSDKKQVVQNLVDVLKNINTDLDELVEAVIYIQIKEPFNWDSLIEQYNPNTVSTRYLNKDTRKDVETYLSKLALIYEKLQSYENNEFIDKLRYVILNYLINLLDIIIYGITQHLESFLSNHINIDTPTLFNLLLAALTYTDQRITYFTFYLTINSIVQKQINILKQSYQINNNLRTMDDFNLGIFRKLKHVFDNLQRTQKLEQLTSEQQNLLQNKIKSITNKLNPVKSNGKPPKNTIATVTDSLESPISDPADDPVAVAVTEIPDAEIPVTSIPVESASDVSVSDVSASVKSVPVTSETVPVTSETVPVESKSASSVPPKYTYNNNRPITEVITKDYIAAENNPLLLAIIQYKHIIMYINQYNRTNTNTDTTNYEKFLAQIEKIKQSSLKKKLTNQDLSSLLDHVYTIAKEANESLNININNQLTYNKILQQIELAQSKKAKFEKIKTEILKILERIDKTKYNIQKIEKTINKTINDICRYASNAWQKHVLSSKISLKKQIGGKLRSRSPFRSRSSRKAK